MIKCNWCGLENSPDATHCSSCGTPLVDEPKPPGAVRRKKSKVVAVALALIFGPLGLLYLGSEGFMVMLVVAGVGTLILPLITAAIEQYHGIGLLITLLARAISAAWAIGRVDERNASLDETDATALLDEATRLENVDFAQAIAKYEELISKHPSSNASVSAKNCLQALQSNKTTAI